jgi:hypothetical protein
LSAALTATPRRISESPAGAFEVSLAANTNGFGLAWYDTRHGQAEIYFRRTDGAGVPVGPERRISFSSTQSYEPSLTWHPGGWLVAWYEVDAAQSSRGRLAGLDPEGRRRWTKTLAHGNARVRNPLVKAMGNRCLLAWLEDDEQGTVVRWAWLNAAAGTWDAPQTAGSAAKDTWNLNGDLGRDGTVFLAWDVARQGRAKECVVYQKPPGSAARILRWPDDGIPSTYPDVRAVDATVVWREGEDGQGEIYLGSLPTPWVGAANLSQSDADSLGAYLAPFPKGPTAWCEAMGAGYAVVLGGRGEKPRALGPTTESQWVPSLAFSGRRLGIAWNTFRSIGPGPHASVGQVYLEVVSIESLKSR